MAKLTKRMMFRMSDEDDAFLEQESEREGVDKSDIVRMMIRHARRNGGIKVVEIVHAYPPAEEARISEEMRREAELEALEASEPRAEEVDVPADDDEPDYYEPEASYQQPTAYLSPEDPTLRPVGVTENGKPYDASGNARVQRHKHLYGSQFGGGYVARAGR